MRYRSTNGSRSSESLHLTPERSFIQFPIYYSELGRKKHIGFGTLHLTEAWGQTCEGHSVAAIQFRKI